MKTGILKKAEKNLLSYLDINSRNSFSNIGKHLRKSQQQISYTVKSLKDKKIIQNFYSVIDYSKINYNILLFRVYFKVIYTKEETYEKLIEYLKEDIYVGKIEECWGSYDLITTFFSRNVSQFNKHIREIMEKFPRHLQNFSVLTTVVHRLFGRQYLNQKIIRKDLFVGGDRLPIIIEETDLKILNMLSQDARLNSVDIANKLKITPKTVINRIKKLEEKEVILGYKTSLNIRNAGCYSNLFLVKYHNITSETENNLINFLKAHPNVTAVVKTLGEWDIEIKIEVEDYNETRKIEREIREKYGNMIKSIQNLPTYKTFQNNYFPKFLLK
jgi:Lrp/AsnC family transcriptional regulator, leucine-responsive regulatory protein